MKTLEDLTPEIKAKISIYKDKCVKDLYSGVEFANYKREDIVEYIEKVYEIVKRKKPVIIIANDPIDYANKFRMLQNEKVLNKVNEAYEKKNDEKNTNNVDYFPEIMSTVSDKYIDKSITVKSHFLFLASTYHRVYLMWYKFIQNEFKIEHNNVDLLNWLYEHGNNNISRCYFTQMYVLVLRMPKYIKRNAVGFHSTDGAAIEWENYKMYYINGRKLSANIFNSILDKKYTFDEFMAETNEDTKAAVITLITEKFGSYELSQFLGATLVNESTITHDSGITETMKLWKTNKTFSFLSDINGNSNQPYAWLELKCPSSGSIYFISTSPHFMTAIESAKFHRPNQVPIELDYNFKQFNN